MRFPINTEKRCKTRESVNFWLIENDCKRKKSSTSLKFDDNDSIAITKSMNINNKKDNKKVDKNLLTRGSALITVLFAFCYFFCFCLQ